MYVHTIGLQIYTCRCTYVGVCNLGWVWYMYNYLFHETKKERKSWLMILMMLCKKNNTMNESVFHNW